MTAEEIRQHLTKVQETRQNAVVSGDYIEAHALWMMFEIAAQLAELNQRIAVFDADDGCFAIKKH